MLGFTVDISNQSYNSDNQDHSDTNGHYQTDSQGKDESSSRCPCCCSLPADLSLMEWVSGLTVRDIEPLERTIEG